MKDPSHRDPESREDPPEPRLARPAGVLAAQKKDCDESLAKPFRRREGEVAKEISKEGNVCFKFSPGVDALHDLCVEGGRETHIS